MKHINKFFIGAAILLASGGFESCVNDLDQLPKDPNILIANDFASNPKEYLGEVMAKCYLGLAVSGQYGKDGGPDIEGIDGGTAQWTRILFYLNTFPTDEVNWIYHDNGVGDMLFDTWGSDNTVIYGAYSRFYVHIAVCNDFLRLARNPGAYGIPVDDELRAELDQFMLEARALRDLSYFNIIDLWGRGTIAWDDMAYGEVPPQAESREVLYNKVVEDLEDVYANWPDNINGSNVVYGRIGKDAVGALLCRYYLNSETWGCGNKYQKCWDMAQTIINNHKGGGFEGSGLATDYLSLFCGTNDMFMPGGSLPAQNEILWGVPYQETYIEPYGGTTFLVLGTIQNSIPKEFPDMEPFDPSGDLSSYDISQFCSPSFYAVADGWGCMQALEQLTNMFNFTNGYSDDPRTYIWLTSNAGFQSENTAANVYNNGYLPIKFTNVECNADGTMPYWTDPITGLPRIGVRVSDSAPFINVSPYNPNTDLPLIRLADVYLMAAECALRGAGDKNTGFDYVTLVQRRANASEAGNGALVWSNQAADYTLDNLLVERAKELWWEMTRRTDLIRFDKFISGYNWNWKNGIYEGTDLAPYRKLMPFPANVMAVYGSAMEQNPGY